MAANTVPAMPSASGAVAGLVAPGAGPITSKSDVGQRSCYCARLHVLAVGGASVPDADLGDAACIVHKAANLLESRGTNSPGEPVLGAKVDELSADMGAVKVKVGELSADMGAVKADMGAVKADMGAVKADMITIKSMMVGIKAGMDNVVHRNMNGINRMMEHNLEPLMAEAGEHVGKYPTQPDPFPATLAALCNLNNAQMDKLEQFYHCKFKGTSIAARQTAFTAFIGALSARA